MKSASMRTASTLALTTALLIGGVSFSSAADAQNLRERAAQQEREKRKRGETGEAQVKQPEGARKYDISSGARKPIAELQTAVQAKDDAAIQAASAAADAAAKTADDRYVIAQLRLRHAIDKDDDALKLAAVDAMIASGGATAEELPALYQNVGVIHLNAQRYNEAGEAYAKLAELQPNNTDAVLQLAEIRNEQGNTPEAIAMIDRAIAAQTAAGQKPPEAWYKRSLRFAYENQLPQSGKISRDLITAYPTPENWRDGLIIYRDTAKLDRPAQLDLMRLMRAAKALNGERDYYELADATSEVGLPGETKAVLDEGTRAGAVSPAKPIFKDLIAQSNGRIAEDRASLAGLEKRAASAGDGKIAANTADAYLGYGDYAKAAALYRTALQKGSVDANVVNTRLGIAHAMAGQKAEAEAAFKAVSGPRTDLAGLWMLWLNNQA